MAPLRIITWNLHGSATPRLDAVAELLKTHEPDVVALQEVRRYQARSVAVLMGWSRPVWAFKHNGYWPLWWRAEGLAVMSRHRLAGHPPVLLTPGVSRRSFRRRILLPVEVVLDDDRRLLVLDAHLASEAGDEEHRLAQAVQLVGVMPGTLPEIVAGDLNAVPGSPPVTTISAAGFVDAWAEVGPAGDPGFTVPANAPANASTTSWCAAATPPRPKCSATSARRWPASPTTVRSSPSSTSTSTSTSRSRSARRVVASVPAMSDTILDVDLLAFERGDRAARRAVVDGVRRSLRTGFVYTSHDLPEELLDQAYKMLSEFFSCPTEVKQRFVAPGSHGQTGYTGVLVETAASSDVPDWKEMLNWGREAPAGHPLRTRYPHRYGPQVLPEAAVPGITEVLDRFHDGIADLQRRFLRVIAIGIGCHEDFFEVMLRQGPHLTRAIHYPAMDLAPSEEHVWAGAHGDINLITALPRATAPGLQVSTDDGWIDAVAPEGQVIVNTGMMLEQLSNGLIPHRHPPRGRAARSNEATATASSSSATPRRGRSSPLCHRASRPTTRSASGASPPATGWTRSCGRSTWSRTAAGWSEAGQHLVHDLQLRIGVEEDQPPDRLPLPPCRRDEGHAVVQQAA